MALQGALGPACCPIGARMRPFDSHRRCEFVVHKNRRRLRQSCVEIRRQIAAQRDRQRLSGGIV